MPSTATDQIAGLSTSVAVKAPCRAVALTNITLSGEQTVNGVACVDGDRVLVTAQTSGVNNGIYVVSTGSWTRSKDFDGQRDVRHGTLVPIVGNGSNSDIYEVTTDDNIVIGTTSIAFTLRFGANTRYDRTAGEIAASVTPVDYFYPPGDIRRYKVNATPGTTTMATAIQNSADSATDIEARIQLQDDIVVEKTLLIKESHQQNTSYIGNGRVSTILRPNAADIKQPGHLINTMFFNEKNNGHVHFAHLRCIDASSYTGIFLYCKEGGGSDAGGQALFSSAVEDCWFGFSSNNTGYFRGGFSNFRVTWNVFESAKTACVRLDGLGNSDQFYYGNVQNGCYDAFLMGTDDTNDKPMLQVIGHNAYQHMRGPLLDLKNVTRSIFSHIVLQPDAANVGTTGIGVFTDATNIHVGPAICKSGTGVPRAALCLAFVNGAQGIITGIQTDATTGIQFSGTGALDLVVENCDFVGCDNAVNWLSGTLSGKVVFRNCRFNNNQAYGLITTAGTHSWDLTLINCEVMNAGLRSTTTDRNFDLNTSGKVRIIRTKFGQDNGSAAATHYIRAQGSGTFEVIDPIIVGTPPTAVFTGSQAISWDGINSLMPGFTALLPSLGGNTTYTSRDMQWAFKNKRMRGTGRIVVNVQGTGSQTVIDLGLSSITPLVHATTYGCGGVRHLANSATNVTASPSGTIAPGAAPAMTLRSFTAAASGNATNNIFQATTDCIFEFDYPVP